MRNFAGSLKDMGTTKYGNLFEYVKNHKYPPGFSKQDKLILRRGARNFELNPKLESLFYLDKPGAHDPEPPSSILALRVNPVPLLVIFRNRGALEFPHIFKMPNQSEAMSDVTRR